MTIFCPNFNSIQVFKVFLSRFMVTQEAMSELITIISPIKMVSKSYSIDFNF